MKKATLAAVAVALVAMVCSTQPAAAQTPPANWNNVPKILLHITSPTTKSACTTWFTNSIGGSCTGAVTSATLGNYFVYVVVAKGDSVPNVAGVQFGITYNTAIDDKTGIDIFSWTLCATLEFQMPSPPWPQSGGGDLITWDYVNVCQTGPVADAGYFYITAYSADMLKIVPRPADGAAKVATCNPDQPEPPSLPLGALGWASFSAGNVTPGCNPCVTPCGAIPVEATTWSNIKSMYR